MIYNLLSNIRAYFDGKTSFAYGEKNFTDLVQWMSSNLKHQKYLEKEISNHRNTLKGLYKIITALQQDIRNLLTRTTKGVIIPDHIFEELIEDCSCDDCPVPTYGKEICPNCDKAIRQGWEDEPIDRGECKELRRAYLMGINVTNLKGYNGEA